MLALGAHFGVYVSFLLVCLVRLVFGEYRKVFDGF